MDAPSPAAAPPPRTFRYLRDPLFLVAVALYLVNRFAIKPFTGNTNDVWHCYVNDLLCAPFWLPPILRVLRACGLRDHDAPPTIGELALLVVSWSWLFEILAPAPFANVWFGASVGDPWDIVAYALGAAVAGCLWRSGRAPLRTTTSTYMGTPASAPRQHLLVAVCIVVASILAAAVPLSQNPWRTNLPEHRRRDSLQAVADAVDAYRQEHGRLPARLTDLGRVWHSPQPDYRVEGESFVLVDLGTDNAPGGLGSAGDMWWPAERQPPRPRLWWFTSPDAGDAFRGGTMLGCGLAAAWLFLRSRTRPPFLRLQPSTLARSAAVIGVFLALGVFALCVQNEFSMSAEQSVH